MSPRRYKSAAREEAADRTRERIIVAAAEILGRGARARDFSLEAAAKLAGVTRLTVYNQFGSRRALLEAVFDDRSRRGGLGRIPEALALADPKAALMRIIAIFCDFWSFDEEAVRRLLAAGTADAEFEESMRERNERRRAIVTALVRRITADAKLKPKPLRELIDTLFALTSFHFYVEMKTEQRTTKDVCTAIKTLAEDVLKRALAREA